MTSYGIDFGTTNSVLAVADSRASVETLRLDEPPYEWAALGFDRVLPTVISHGGGDTVDFGWRAKRSPQSRPAVKRLFKHEDEDVTVGGLTLKVEAAAARIFRHIRDMAAGSGHTLDRAVVTIPANSRGRARFRTKVSAQIAGMQVLTLVNEPTAAAIAYARRIRDGERVLVFDWGGGTLDVTVLLREEGMFIEEASKGIQELGGIDIDETFKAALMPRVPAGSTVDPMDVELAKIRLSEQDEITLPLIGGGTVTATRAELEDAIRPLILRTKEPIDQCTSDLRGARIDHLVLVGGSAKIPAVRRFVREMLRLDPMEGVDPMTAVGEGAAIAAGIFRGEITDYDFSVSTEHALGTVVLDSDSLEPRFSPIIARNTGLPARGTESYTPVVDNTPSLLVRVMEGDPEKPFDHDDNVELKTYEVALDPRPAAEATFDMTYFYDDEGILHVTAVDCKTGSPLLDKNLVIGGAAEKEDLVAIRRRVDTLHRARAGAEPAPTAASAPPDPPVPTLAAASREAVRKAKQKVYPFVDDATQKEIDGCVAALTAAGPGGEDAAREALERVMLQHAYLLD